MKKTWISRGILIADTLMGDGSLHSLLYSTAPAHAKSTEKILQILRATPIHSTKLYTNLKIRLVNRRYDY
ncbi:hypothetical protein LWI28_000696 [Acer negundo]|uniref:Uncharacterized protein n=1 Tax=Acer negundo TaxID=4023 RepID=A0AAD5NW00_ACENE|nr:hypothetical protein LWI28_000696 [Acer negundo]